MYIYRSGSNLLNIFDRLVSVGDPPPEFDSQFYRQLHNDLFSLSDADLTHRYESCDRNLGRIASPGAYRGGLLASIDPDKTLLEIGPYTRPTFRGPNIRYFDLADAAALQARAQNEGMPTTNCPNIDYVSPTGDMSIVPDNSFDTVFSSHCIEHQPDLIRHLRHVERVLKPSGRYYLAVPDKRYCFDHFIPTSTVETVVAAHDQRHVVHTMLNVFRYFADTTHNDPARHWDGDHGPQVRPDREERIQQAIDLHYASHGRYIDVHAWQFVPQTFSQIMRDLHASGLTTLGVERVYDTVYGQNEFMAVLRLTK